MRWGGFNVSVINLDYCGVTKHEGKNSKNRRTSPEEKEGLKEDQEVI